MLMFRQYIIPVLVLFGASIWFATAQDPLAQHSNNDLAHDEQTLKRFGIASDGPSLLEFFRRRTRTDEELDALRKRAAQLGSGVFSVRAKATDELIRVGRVALPALRETAKSSDPETARRAEYCIGVIEQNTNHGLPAYAARVLVERKPPGTIETLLAYLPFADETWIEEEIRDSIKRIAFVDGKAADVLEHALTDPMTPRRAAAAWIVGYSNDPQQRQKVMERLADDSSDVRLRAASSLLATREPQAVPVVIALLTVDSAEIAGRAEDLLFRLAGESAPAVWLGGADNNGRKVQSAWQAWWKAYQPKIDWKSIKVEDQPFGYTLIAENQRPDGSGQLYELNKAGQIRWQVKIQNPIDVQPLSGGRVLVADSRASQIYEMDSRGVIGWKHTGLAPTSVQRLPNGNTVVSTYQKIMEVTREGKVIFTHVTQGHTYHARKLPDNHYVWIDASGEIAEIDANGKLLHKTRLGGGLAWGSIEPLRNGRYLVALGGVGKVQEVDMAGKVYWEKSVNNPNRATRLANGNTLVASHGDACVYEFDSKGNELWKRGCTGRPFAALRR